MKNEEQALPPVGGDQEALEKIQGLASKAVGRMRVILTNPKTSVYTKIQVISAVLERTYGKPETMLNLEAAGGNLEEERKRVMGILERIRV